MAYKTYKYCSYPHILRDNVPSYHIAQKPASKLEIKSKCFEKVYFIQSFVKQVNSWVFQMFSDNVPGT